MYLRKIKRVISLFLLPYRNTLVYFFTSGQVRYPSFFMKKTYYVDPLRITKLTSLPIKPKYGSTFFLDGDWDKNADDVKRAFDDNYKYRTARKIIVQKIPSSDTEECLYVEDVISAEGSYRGFNDPMEYMKFVQNLYNSISTDGYKIKKNRFGSWFGEVEVAIGREGELIKINSGNHRFACAYLLGLKSIPVNLCAVHSNHKEKLMGDGVLKLAGNIEKII